MSAVHRAVMALGLLLALVGALFWVIGGPPVAASAGAVAAGLVIALAGWWLGRRKPATAEPPEFTRPEPAQPEPEPAPQAHAPTSAPDQVPAVARSVDAGPADAVAQMALPIEAPAAKPAAAVAEAPAPVAQPPAAVAETPAAIAEPAAESPTTAELDPEAAREAELHAIAEELRALKGKGLDLSNVPEWTARIEAWVDADLEARAARGEEVSPQAANFMRDFGEIPRDWRRHLLRHLRRLGYRRYQEGEW
jgi:hypothetical protein